MLTGIALSILSMPLPTLLISQTLDLICSLPPRVSLVIILICRYKLIFRYLNLMQSWRRLKREGGRSLKLI